jgi:hypothetical protein
MRELKPRFYILSAERYTETDTINFDRTENLERSLIALGLSYKRVVGCYEGTREASFLVPDKGAWVAWDGCDTFACVQGLADVFDQDSFLERHPDGAAEIHELHIGRDGNLHSYFIGTFQEGTPGSEECYTHDPSTGVSYVCR